MRSTRDIHTLSAWIRILLPVVALALLIGCGRDPRAKKFAKELKLLKNGTTEERADAILHIADMGELAKDALPYLIKALDDPESKVVVTASTVLARIGEPSSEVASKLIEIIEKETDTKVVSSALNCLNVIGAKDDKKKVIVALMNNESGQLRADAALSIFRLGADGVEFLPLLVQGIKDKDPNVRMYSSLALGSLGSKASSALPELNKLLDDEVDYVREEAQRAVQKIEGN
tara:strand:+ start:900 stop:1595 length:696 start_codon:yes stop_codon:yes gene_type:complete